MSTLTKNLESKVLQSEKDLEGYFQKYAKHREAMRVGLEAEFFAVDRRTGKARPYEGPDGIEAILKRLAARFHYSLILERESVIALKRGNTYISLEPGGQVELSAEPVSNVFEIEEQIREFAGELRKVCADFPDLAWLAAGIHPFSGLDEIVWVPKERYAIMARHFENRGVLSHHMMKRTATNQINVDYLSEENAMESLRVAFGISSIVTALFANSSFSEGAPNGFVCRRLDIWNQTDPDRTGLLLQFLKPGRTFRDYLDYLLGMPMIFIVRKNQWIPLSGRLSFREFIEQGFQGHRATLGDFELHLGTAFPEVRLKQYLEIRGVDCQKPDLIPAVAAFWKGILYDPDARRRAWKLVEFATEAERLKLHREVPKKGLRADLGGKPIFPIAEELVNISCASLARQKLRDKTRDECFFLERIRKLILRPGKSPAEQLLEKWRGDFNFNPERVIEYLSV